ncbi:hypothetical protein OF83DRAFT_1159670 [Amylostereum chailletii]|nr:hypothetical protein OF83DRAFT_1159670 [Amylostereum chailletii]
MLPATSHSSPEEMQNREAASLALRSLIEILDNIQGQQRRLQTEASLIAGILDDVYTCTKNLHTILRAIDKDASTTPAATSKRKYTEDDHTLKRRRPENIANTPYTPPSPPSSGAWIFFGPFIFYLDPETGFRAVVGELMVKDDSRKRFRPSHHSCHSLPVELFGENYTRIHFANTVDAEDFVETWNRARPRAYKVVRAGILQIMDYTALSEDHTQVSEVFP